MMNLHQSKPLHYDDINPGLWGTCLLELAKDIAAVKIVEHLEEAQRGCIPDAEEYFILDWTGVVTWWSPTDTCWVRTGRVDGEFEASVQRVMTKHAKSLKRLAHA